MTTVRQSTGNADAAATAVGNDHVRRLQILLQGTVEQLVALGRTDIVLAVVEQVVGASGGLAVEPDQPDQPGQPGQQRQPQEQPPAKRLRTAAAAAATAQPSVPRYVVPPATGSLAFGSSHWDAKPIEIHAMILKAAGPLTRFLCGLLGDKRRIDEVTKLQLWTDALKMDWQGDLALLPDVELSANNGLLLAHSRSMYDRLCERFPQHTEPFWSGSDTLNNSYDIPPHYDSWDSRRLILIPMWHGWYDLVDFKYPITLARMAIRYGCLDLLEHLDITYNTLQDWMAKHDPASEYWHGAVDQAARYGQLDVVMYLFVAGVTGCTTAAMDSAAENGHLHVVKWLHEHRAEGCTANAMDCAAINGHLYVVKWLHENRTEGCTKMAMDRAARNGHLHVVIWLHANRTEGCTTWAMDWAAGNGQLHVIKWLHDNRREGYTNHAMDWAAMDGHLDVVIWFHEVRGEECTPIALDAAINNGRMNVVKYMHSKGSRASNDVIDRMPEIGNAEMLQYLVDNGYSFEPKTLSRAKTAAIANILLGSLTMDRALTLLARAKQGEGTKLTIKRLESAIKKLQKPRK